MLNVFKSKRFLNIFIISSFFVLGLLFINKEIANKFNHNFINEIMTSLISKNTELTATSSSQDVTNSLVYLGKPVKKSKAYANNIWDMQIMNNKIYLGHGDWNANAGPIPIISYNILNNTFVTEDTAYDEQIWRLKMVDGELWIPGTDANNVNYYSNTIVGWDSGSWSWGNLYRLTDGGWKIYRNTPGGVHVLDIVKFNDRLYATQGVSGTSDQIVVSSNNGDTWTSAVPNNTVCTGINSRCWSIFELNGKLYSVGGFMNTSTSANSNNTNIVTFEADGTFTKSIIKTASFLPGLNIGTTKSKYIMDKQINYENKLLFIVNSPISTNNNSATNGDTDNMFNPVAMYISSSISSSTRLIFPDNKAIPSDFIVRDDGVYVLTRVDNGTSGFTNIVYKANSVSMTTTASDWTELFRFNTAVEVFARSFEELDGDFYFGFGGAFMETSSTDVGKVYKISSEAWAPKAKIETVTIPTGIIQNGSKIAITATVSNVSTCSLDHGIGNVAIIGTMTNGIYTTGTINLTNVTAYPSYKLSCTNKIWNGTVTKKVYLTMNTNSNVADLKSLNITEGVISPSFDPDITEYTLLTSNMFSLMPSNLNALNLNYSVADSTSRVEIIGNNLIAGNNKVGIKVTAADGTIKTYNIHVKVAPSATYNVYRTKSGEADIKLDLVTDNTMLSPQIYAISPVGGGNYKIQIIPKDSNVTVKVVTPESASAGVTISNNTITGTIPAAGNWKMFTIILTTPDGTRSEQRIAIHGKSNTATLSSISVVKTTGPTTNYTLTPVFSSSVYEYEITELIPSTVTSLTVNATASNRGTRIIKGNTNLIGGKNVIEIMVTSEDLSLTRIYKITVTKPDDMITLETTYKKTDSEIYLEDNVAVTNFLSNIQSNGTATKVYSMDKTKEITDGIIGTGMVLNITKGNTTKEYTLIVKGDVNGDGKVTVTDVSKLYSHVRQTNIMTDNAYLKAGDTNSDSNITVTDVSKLYSYIRNVIQSL